jgi:hypothetical protein
MGVQHPNSTGYVHPDEPNLLNLHKAMEYDEVGVPHVRVRLGADNITITGNVNLIDNVRVNNTEAQSIPVYIVGNVIAVNQNTSPWVISANSSVNSDANPIYVNFTNDTISLASGSATIGNVNLNTGNNVIGNVRLEAGNNIIGNVRLEGNLAGITGNLAGITGNIAGVTGNIAGITSNVFLGAGNNIIGNVRLEGNLAGITGNIAGVTGNIAGITSNVFLGAGNNIIGNVRLEGNLAGITGNVNVTQGTDPWKVTGNVIVTGGNISGNVSYNDSVQMDSSSRLRVSVMGQQWWYVPSIDKDGDLRIQEAFQGTGASSTFIQNLASVRLTSGQTYNANAKLTGSTIRASRRRHKTRPGVTGEWIGIVNWDGLQLNVVKRIGLFTSFNGVFFEARIDGVYAVVRRRLTDGTLVETAKHYSEWSIDQMDGNGPTEYDWNTTSISADVTSVYSQATVAIPGDGNVYTVTYQMTGTDDTKVVVGNKVTLTGLTPTTFNDTGLITSINAVNHRVTVAYIVDPGSYVSASSAKMTNTKFHAMHTYWIDFSGSRTTRVRFGLVTDVGKVCVHEYLGGEIGTQFMNAPALMDRKEIVNMGQPVEFLPSMTVGGSAVTIETQADINPGFGVARTTTAITFNKNSQVNSEFAIIGVGLRPGEPYQRADLQVNKIQLVDLGNLNPQNAGIFQWRLVLNPTTSNAPTYTDVGKATHRLTYAQGTTASGGIELIDGYSQGTFTSDVSTALNFLNMGSNIDYTDTDIVVLMVKLLIGGTDNSSVMATINYTEDL